MLDTAVRHREKALGLVSGVRSFMRSLPITAWFACTETARSTLGDLSLNTHAHTLMVLEPPKSGRRYIRQDDWPEVMEQVWQRSCPDGVDCAPERLVALSDALSWASYLTKPASFVKYAAVVRAQLASPELFMEQAEALHGVSRYFGPMAKLRKLQPSIH